MVVDGFGVVGVAWLAIPFLTKCHDLQNCEIEFHRQVLELRKVVNELQIFLRNRPVTFASHGETQQCLKVLCNYGYQLRGLEAIYKVESRSRSVRTFLGWDTRRIRRIAARLAVMQLKLDLDAKSASGEVPANILIREYSYKVCFHDSPPCQINRPNSTRRLHPKTKSTAQLADDRAGAAKLESQAASVI